MYVAAYPKGSAPILLHPDGTGEAFFQYPYNELTDYSKDTEEIPNNEYATVLHHPSDAVAAYDASVPAGIPGAKIYQDEVDPYQKNPGGHTSVTNGDMIDYVKTAASGHAYAKAECQTVNVCGASDLVGSPCGGPNGERGYCFTSEAGSLLCGRMTSVLDEYEQKKTALDLTAFYGTLKQEPYRCPRGTPATELGTITVQRLLIGGCMVNGDSKYEPIAEIQVPTMCADDAGESLTGLQTGCMFPGAENFNPDAKTPDDCHYLTYGCKDSNALNYNPDATLDATTAPLKCVMPKEGCTIKTGGYAGVDADTPHYQARTVGLELRAVGEITFSPYPDVTNYDPDANVLKGCEVAIEGCMDEYTDGVKNINYVKQATVNSNSWCIPEVQGCMMPASTNALQPWPAEAHDREGFAYNYDASATVHNSSMCIIRKLGCMTEGKLNYDKYATVEDFCYTQLSGCLDSAALNQGCKTPGLTGCPNGLVDKDPEQITHHQEETCTFYYSPPPSPPPPAYPPDTRVTVTGYAVEISVIVDGTPTPEELAAAVAKVQAAYPNATVTATVEAIEDRRRLEERRRLDDHARIVFTITTNNEADALVIKADIAAQTGGSVEMAQIFFGDSITVDSIPLIVLTPVYDVTPAPTPPPPSLPPPSSSVPIGAIVGGVVGGVLGCVCIIGLVVFLMKKKNKSVKPDY